MNRIRNQVELEVFLWGGPERTCMEPTLERIRRQERPMRGPRKSGDVFTCDGCECLRTRQAGLKVVYGCRNTKVSSGEPKPIGQVPITPSWCPETEAVHAETSDGGGYHDADAYERGRQAAIAAGMPDDQAKDDEPTEPNTPFVAPDSGTSEGSEGSPETQETAETAAGPTEGDPAETTQTPEEELQALAEYTKAAEEARKDAK